MLAFSGHVNKVLILSYLIIKIWYCRMYDFVEFNCVLVVATSGCFQFEVFGKIRVELKWDDFIRKTNINFSSDVSTFRHLNQPRLAERLQIPLRLIELVTKLQLPVRWNYDSHLKYCFNTCMFFFLGGGGGGGSYFPYILLNGIGTMLSQLAKQSYWKLSADSSIAH